MLCLISPTIVYRIIIERLNVCNNQFEVRMNEWTDLEIWEGLVGEQSGLSDDSGEGQHGETTILK